jgi:hypothetical protein
MDSLALLGVLRAPGEPTLSLHAYPRHYKKISQDRWRNTQAHGSREYVCLFRDGAERILETLRQVTPGVKTHYEILDHTLDYLHVHTACPAGTAHRPAPATV